MNPDIFASIIKNMIPVERREEILGNVERAVNLVLSFDSRLAKLEMMMAAIMAKLEIQLAEATENAGQKQISGSLNGSGQPPALNS